MRRWLILFLAVLAPVAAYCGWPGSGKKYPPSSGSSPITVTYVVVGGGGGGGEESVTIYNGGGGGGGEFLSGSGSYTTGNNYTLTVGSVCRYHRGWRRRRGRRNNLSGA